MCGRKMAIKLLEWKTKKKFATNLFKRKFRTSLLAMFIFLGTNVYLAWEVILNKGRKN